MCPDWSFLCLVKIPHKAEFCLNQAVTNSSKVVQLRWLTPHTASPFQEIPPTEKGAFGLLFCQIADPLVLTSAIGIKQLSTLLNKQDHYLIPCFNSICWYLSLLAALTLHIISKMLYHDCNINKLSYWRCHLMSEVSACKRPTIGLNFGICSLCTN